MLRELFVLGALLLAWAWAPRTAWAQSAPQLQLRADDGVGVGETFTLQLTATSADDMPADPQPGATQGFIVRAQNQAPAQTHIIMNGARTDRYTLNVTWALEAQRAGTFKVGPASVVVGGKRYASQALTIHVLPPGQAARRRAAQPQFPQFPPGFQSPFGVSPFDLWKGMIQGFDSEPQPPPQAPEVDPKLALDAPRGAALFLHATVDKTTAAVGEQVIFTVYEYTDVSARSEVDGQDVRDASVPDFARHPLLREDQVPPLEGFAAVGGRTWEVRVVRRWALFPLRAGDLTIGPMRERLVRAGASGVETRTTETLLVHAVEPPLAHRPPGYALGDVGRFTLHAQVSPRQIDQGGAIAVHVELAGTGNLPSALAVPAREGVEWLPPDVKEELGPVGTDRMAFGGKRTFDYVVRVQRAGSIDLGEISLPFWSPAERRYDVARAPLGAVNVTAVASAAGAAPAPPDVLPGLPALRETLDGTPAARAHWDDSPAFWLLGVASWPVAFGAAVAGRAGARRAREAWRRRRQSPATELRQKLSAAHAACREGDARSADAAIARALEAAVVAHAGVSVRGALGDEVVSRLERAGVGGDAASHVADLLRECEAARFAPEAADIVAARDRWARAQGAIRSLERGA